MNTVVIEHVALNELPAAWRARLPVSPDARVTVRIEEEPATTAAVSPTDDPAFGIWQNRTDLDVEAYVRQLRAPRYRWDGSRNED